VGKLRGCALGVLALLVSAGAGTSGCSLALDPTDLSRGSDRSDPPSDPYAGSIDAGPGAQDEDGFGARVDNGTTSGDDGGAVAHEAGLSDAAPSVTCPGFALFCDDFESGGLTRWSQVLTTNNGLARVDGALDGGGGPFRGAYAMRLWAGTNPSVGGVVKASTANVNAYVPAMTTGAFVYRFYVYVPAVLVTDTSLAKLAHRDPLSFPEDVNLKVVNGGGVDRWRINVDNAVANDASFDSAAPVPIGRWTCLEWSLTIGHVGRLTLSADGATVIDVAEDTVGTMAAGYDDARVGISYSPGTVVQQVFVDDVALATQKIGCE